MQQIPPQLTPLPIWIAVHKASRRMPRLLQTATTKQTASPKQPQQFTILNKAKKTPHTAQATKRKRHDKHPQHCQATRHACNKATNCNKRPKMFPLQQTAHQTEQLLQMHCAPQQPQQKNDGEKFAVVFVCTTCFCNKAQGPSRQNSFGCIPTSRDIACRYRANGIEQIPKFG